MRYFQRSAICAILSMIFLTSSASAFSRFYDGPSGKGRRGCGDYTILSDSRDREVFERHCGTNEESDFRILRASVNRLDPKREAHAAALRGDFRLAAVTHGGPPHPDETRFWYAEGVNCDNIDDSDVFIWIRQSDAMIPGGSHGGYESDMTKFAKAYNIAIFSERSFPSHRSCKITP